jgi:hypothetical protein
MLLFNVEPVDELRHPLTSLGMLLILIVWREIRALFVLPTKSDDRRRHRDYQIVFVRLINK